MASQAGPSHQGDRPQRILCPVTCCPESLTSSIPEYYDFASIRKHLNSHYTGQLTGAIPVEFLRVYGYSLCNVCDKTLSSRFKGTCPKCKPSNRRQINLNSFRNRNGSGSISVSSVNQQHGTQNADALLSLLEVHKKFVPTIRNIALSLRSLWAQCLAKAFANATWNNDIASWTELQMLAKCTLCLPPRAGKSHKSQRLSWTRNCLSRCLAGELATLWQDLPKYQPPRKRQFSEKASKKARQD